MTKRLERVRAVATDLFRLLDRAHGQSLGTRAMADQIRNDAEAVLRLLKHPGIAIRIVPASRRAGYPPRTVRTSRVHNGTVKTDPLRR